MATVHRKTPTTVVQLHKSRTDWADQLSIDRTRLAATGNTPPGPSIAERDRRWGAVRELLDRAGVDLLIVVGRGDAADVRYLSNAPSTAEYPRWILFPRSGDPVGIGEAVDTNRESDAWITFHRQPGESVAEATISVLRSSMADDHRIAIALGGPNADVVPVGFRAAIRSAFPAMDVTNVGSALRELRRIKSAEEVALLRHATRLLDAAYAYIDEVAHPGITAHALWGAAIGELCRLGSEPSSHQRWASAARPRALARPAHAALVSGFVASAELEATVHGYAARSLHNRAIGQPGPVVPEIFAIVGELWEHARQRLRAGAPLDDAAHELRARSRKLVKPRGGMQTATTLLTLRGLGLGGDDLNVQFSSRSGGPKEVTPVPKSGWICTLGVTLQANIDGRQYVASWSDPIVIAEGDSARLGTRAPGAFRVGEAGA